MALKVLVATIVINLSIPELIGFAMSEAGLDKIMKVIKRQNNELGAAKQSYLASKHLIDGSAYLPDPIVKLKVFPSPIETRNGSQSGHLVMIQPLAWPSELKAKKSLTMSAAKVMKEQIDLMHLDLEFKAKEKIFKYVELSEKLTSKKRMILVLNDLSQVILGRIKVGGGLQSEISRINIEVTSLKQESIKIRAEMIGIQQNLSVMAGGKDIAKLIPTVFNPAWGILENFNPNTIDFSSHPLVRMSKAKISSAQANIELAKAGRLPKLAASLSWLKIEKPTSNIATGNAGKDAWAAEVSVSIPIWASKYDAIDSSSIAKRSVAEFNLSQHKLELASRLRSIFEEYKSAKDISMMFQNDILIQANQALNADRDSYSRGSVPFERIIENSLRVLNFEDQLIQSLLKQATYKAAMENLIGRSL